MRVCRKTTDSRHVHKSCINTQTCTHTNESTSQQTRTQSDTILCSLVKCKLSNPVSKQIGIARPRIHGRVLANVPVTGQATKSRICSIFRCVSSHTSRFCLAHSFTAYNGVVECAIRSSTEDQYKSVCFWRSAPLFLTSSLLILVLVVVVVISG